MGAVPPGTSVMPVDLLCLNVAISEPYVYFRSGRPASACRSGAGGLWVRRGSGTVAAGAYNSVSLNVLPGLITEGSQLVAGPLFSAHVPQRSDPAGREDAGGAVGGDDLPGAGRVGQRPGRPVGLRHRPVRPR